MSLSCIGSRVILKRLTFDLLRSHRCACACHRQALVQQRIPSCSRPYTSHDSPVGLSYEVFEPKTLRAASLPILILHGVCGSKKNWESLAKRITNQLSRMVVTIDARNHGDSYHSPIMSYEAMASDVLSLMKRDLGTERCDLIGHSMGGRTGIALALSQPQALNRLVVVDVTHNPPPPSQETSVVEYLAFMKDAYIDQSLSLPLAKRDVGKQLEEGVPETTVRLFLLTNLIEESGVIRWRLNLDALETNIESLKRLKVPPGARFHGDTLFIGGANSNYLRPDDYPGIRSLFPNVSFSLIEGAGHWVHSEKPKEFLQDVLPFLSECT